MWQGQIKYIFSIFCTGSWNCIFCYCFFYIKSAKHFSSRNSDHGKREAKLSREEKLKKIFDRSDICVETLQFWFTTNFNSHSLIRTRYPFESAAIGDMLGSLLLGLQCSSSGFHFYVMLSKLNNQVFIMLEIKDLSVSLKEILLIFSWLIQNQQLHVFFL